MIDYKEQAGRWLAQAEYDLKEATNAIKKNSFAYACFFSEQSAQKSLKAFLISNKDTRVSIHAITELLKRASVFNKKFTRLIKDGRELDKFYLTTRYPDALPSPLIPYENYTEKEAREAEKIAREIFNLCKKIAKTSK